MTAREKLLAEIDAFLERHNMRETAFGIKAVNDPALVSDMRYHGRSVRIDTAERLREFMASYKPEKRPKRAAASHAAA
jgi:hypothetical protein